MNYRTKVLDEYLTIYKELVDRGTAALTHKIAIMERPIPAVEESPDLWIPLLIWALIGAFLGLLIMLLITTIVTLTNATPGATPPPLQ